MSKQELKASELLLDLGVAVPIRPLRLLKRSKTRKIIMRRPYQGTLIRIARKYLQLGVKYEEIKDYNYEQNMQLIAGHTKLISEMVAYTIVRGYVTGFLFNKLVAWWLRWRVHPLFLQEAWYQMLTMLDIHSFQTIIRSAEMMNMMKPRLSHTAEGS